MPQDHQENHKHKHKPHHKHNNPTHKKKRIRPTTHPFTSSSSSSSSPSAAAAARPSYPSPHIRQGRFHQDARKALPIWQQRATIVQAVRDHPSTILVGETGSGKSTQVPQFLLDAGFCAAVAATGGAAAASKGTSTSPPATARDQPQKHERKLIVCTQPRRVAAMTVAGRVAEEMGTRLGQAVGYAVRFDDKTSNNTVIKYVTDGVLLREAMADPLLTRYAVVVLDEAHERSLQTDILFGLIRRAQRQRSDLRVVVMSATLEVDLFVRYFASDEDKEKKGTDKASAAAEGGGKGGGEGKENGTASTTTPTTTSNKNTAVVRVEGRQYGVDVYYTHEAQDDVIDAAYVTTLQLHETSPVPGDILVFLSGQEDIEALAELLNEHADTPLGPMGYRMEICPLFAALPPEQQLKAFRPPVGNAAVTRKVILATNIAETSVTINGIRFVIDSGWLKVRRYVPSTGLDSLKVTQVAQAQAQQRAGRAGREAPGACYRLYTEDAYETLSPAPEPEIQRVNLAQVVLQLLTLGISDPQHFDYLSPPSPDALKRALETLFALNCITEGKDPHTHKPCPAVTPHGRQVATLPLDPLYAHFVLRAAELNCLSEALTAVSMLSAENVLYMPSPHGSPDAQEQRAKAITAHKALAAYEGDVPTLLHVYERWVAAKRSKTWCWDHFINARAMEKAHEVREQLVTLTQRLGLDPTSTCGNEKQVFLRCLAASLFLNIAKRQASSLGTTANNGGGGNGGGSGRGCYKTLQTGKEVAIHPSSVLHGRNPPPPYLVYTEVLTTTKTYIRGVTMADATALQELVPQFFGGGNGGGKG